MLKPKKKLSRRELKQDKFVTLTLKAKAFIEDNSKLLVRVSVGLLILIILITLYVRSKRSANIDANALLGEAQLAMQLSDMERAQNTLNQLVTDYDGVSAAGQGCFLLAKLYWKQEDFSNAKIYFKKYIDDYADDDLLLSAALAGYADCLMNELNLLDAAKYYERAGKVNDELPAAPSYLLSAASVYFELKDYQKAKNLTEQILDNEEWQSYQSRAEVLLNKIKFSG